MKFLKNLLIIFTVILLGGLLFSLINSSSDGDKDNNFFDDIIDELPWGDDTDTDEDNVTVNVIGGTQGFTSDFSGVALYNASENDVRMLINGVENPSRLLGQSGIVTYTMDDDMINYECVSEGSWDMSTYPKLKLKPLDNKFGTIFLRDFKVLTADFDIAYDINSEHFSAYCFRVLPNTWSKSSNTTAVSSTDKYHSIESTGSGHYTFVYYDTGDAATMRILVYKDGELVNTITDFLNLDIGYDEEDLFISCLNIELPFAEGDKVSIDNVEFHYFDDAYDGAIMDLIANPEAGLKSCKDAVLYEG